MFDVDRFDSVELLHSPSKHVLNKHDWDTRSQITSATRGVSEMAENVSVTTLAWKSCGFIRFASYKRHYWHTLTINNDRVKIKRRVKSIKWPTSSIEQESVLKKFFKANSTKTNKKTGSDRGLNFTFVMIFANVQFSTDSIWRDPKLSFIFYI